MDRAAEALIYSKIIINKNCFSDFTCDRWSNLLRERLLFFLFLIYFLSILFINITKLFMRSRNGTEIT